ncbi:MAG: vitamin K epoxide reductase family protein [Chloroflexi bacterium]|nr:vitamin K epoxide reductase family protein [Chloroflexota bacterium]
MLGLLAVLLFCVWQLGGRWAALTQAGGALNSGKGRSGLMGALMAIGLVVSGYLAYVETTHVTAVCGPVGECNIVQSSPYAHIFGIPIAVLGLLFYISVAGLWLLQRVETWQRLAVLALVGLAFGGTLFSLYLTLLELLVIGAVCMWCLTSAVATGLICLLVTWWALKRPLPPDPQWQAS